MSGVSLDLQVENLSRGGGVPTESEFRAWVLAALADRSSEAELGIRVVDEDEGLELNRQYRDQDKPTNVLSFPAELPDGIEHPLLGDLVLCAPVVRREAAEQDKDPAAHWAHLVVHGTLHLLGFDHQQEPEAREMEMLEINILAGMGLPDPYRDRAAAG